MAMVQDGQGGGVGFAVQERPEVPVLGLLMGGAAMVPFVLLVLGLWFGPADWAATALHWLTAWGAAILAFLAGVRRGLSFRIPGGARPAQIATVFWLFLLAIASLVVPSRLLSLGLLATGFASLAVLDPSAARRQEAPLFFARLRPIQMAIPVTALAVAWLWAVRHA